jgi:hypothetical protein
MEGMKNAVGMLIQQRSSEAEKLLSTLADGLGARQDVLAQEVIIRASLGYALRHLRRHDAADAALGMAGEALFRVIASASSEQELTAATSVLPPAFLAAVAAAAACVDDGVAPWELCSLELRHVIVDEGKEAAAALEHGDTSGSGSVPAQDLHSHPQLAFKIGLATGLAMHAAGHEAEGRLRNIARAVKGLQDVQGIALRSVLLATGGNDLHAAAAAGDPKRVDACLQHVDRCQPVQTRNGEDHRFKRGDQVILAEGYQSLSDAESGPLSPGDVGTVEEVRYEAGNRVNVEYNGRRWWYDPEALLPQCESVPDASEAGCKCTNCVNARDHQGRTALHVAATRFSDFQSFDVLYKLVEKGANRYAATKDGRTALHHLLESPAVRAHAKPPVALLLATDLLSCDALFETPPHSPQCSPVLPAEKSPAELQTKGHVLSPVFSALQSDAPNAILIFDRLLANLQQWEATAGAERKMSGALELKSLHAHEVEDGGNGVENAEMCNAGNAGIAGKGVKCTVLEVVCKRFQAASTEHHRRAAGLALARILSPFVKEEVRGENRCCSLKLPSRFRSMSTVPVEAGIAALGLAWNAGSIAGVGECGPSFSGVKAGLSLRSLLDEGWKMHLQALYSSPTSQADLDPGRGKWLLVGARQRHSETLLLAAVARREDVVKVTDSDRHNETHFANGVYWYNSPGKAFGFSSHPNVELRSADICDEEGHNRLSWHLTSQGGWRAGHVKNLNRDSEGSQYEKIILVSSSERRGGQPASAELFQGRRVMLKEESEGKLFEACRLDGTRCVVSAGDLKAKRAATLLEMGQGSLQGKWRVSADAARHGPVIFWADERLLQPCGASFPMSVSFAECQLAHVPSALQLRSIGNFPLQAVTALSLACNSLHCLPDDFVVAFPRLSSLDLTRNLFSSFPAALGSSLCLREVDLQRNARLEEGTWLNEVMTKWPSFPSDPPPMLEHVRVDFQLLSAASRMLLLTLAKRTIERSVSTSIDLSGRGLGDAEVLALMPQLLDACDRRKGVAQVQQSTLLPHPQEETLALIHEHRLVSDFSSGGCCDVCGNVDIEGAETEGFSSEHPLESKTEDLRNDKGELVSIGRGDKYVCGKPFGLAHACGVDGAQCESCQRLQGSVSKATQEQHTFFVCRSCVDYIGQSGPQCLCCIDAAGRRIEFLLDGSRLRLRIDGELSVGSVADIRYDAEGYMLCVRGERRSYGAQGHAFCVGEESLQIQRMTEALLLRLSELAARASGPRCTWSGDEPRSG